MCNRHRLTSGVLAKSRNSFAGQQKCENRKLGHWNPVGPYDHGAFECTACSCLQGWIHTVLRCAELPERGKPECSGERRREEEMGIIRRTDVAGAHRTSARCPEDTHYRDGSTDGNTDGAPRWAAWLANTQPRWPANGRTLWGEDGGYCWATCNQRKRKAWLWNSSANALPKIRVRRRMYENTKVGYFAEIRGFAQHATCALLLNQEDELLPRSTSQC